VVIYGGQNAGNVFINTYLWCHKTCRYICRGPAAYRWMCLVPPGLLQLSADRPAGYVMAAWTANLFRRGLGDFCYRASPAAIFTVSVFPSLAVNHSQPLRPDRTHRVAGARRSASTDRTHRVLPPPSASSSVSADWPADIHGD